MATKFRKRRNVPYVRPSVRGASRGVYDNSLSALVPAFWANESLAILEENMVVGNLIHKDFSPLVANFGDTVNTRRPGEFTAKRKWTSDNVTIQDATSTNVQVKLNQHIHVSFVLKDGEVSLSMKDLVTMYMAPAMLANARFIDRVLLGQYPQFLANSVGKIGAFTGQTVKDTVIDVREKLNDNKAYTDNRNLIIGTDTEGAMLKPEFFTSAEKVGDQGTALRTASLGEKFGLNFFMSQNTPQVKGVYTTRTFQINNATGYPAGTTTSLTVDTGTGEITVGSWVDIDGVPYQVTARTGTAPTTAITLDRALLRAVVDNQVVTPYTPGAVNNGAGYAAGWYGDIAYDGFALAKPKVGALVSFGSDVTNRYSIVDTNGSTTIVLDRPLEAAIVDDATLNITSPGNFNLAFHRNALAIVTRPLALPMMGAGANSAVVSYNGLSIRATVAYLAEKQGHLVTLDLLFGVKPLDTNLAAVMLT